MSTIIFLGGAIAMLGLLLAISPFIHTHKHIPKQVCAMHEITMDRRDIKLNLALELFAMICNKVNAGVISREEAAEVVKVLGECISQTNEAMISEGKEVFIKTPHPAQGEEDGN